MPFLSTMKKKVGQLIKRSSEEKCIMLLLSFSSPFCSVTLWVSSLQHNIISRKQRLLQSFVALLNGCSVEGSVNCIELLWTDGFSYLVHFIVKGFCWLHNVGSVTLPVTLALSWKQTFLRENAVVACRYTTCWVWSMPWVDQDLK